MYQYEREQSRRNPRLPKSLERDRSRAGGRAREPPAPAVHHLRDTRISAEGFGHPASVPWAAAPADELREL